MYITPSSHAKKQSVVVVWPPLYTAHSHRLTKTVPLKLAGGGGGGGEAGCRLRQYRVIRGVDAQGRVLFCEDEMQRVLILRAVFVKALPAICLL